MDREAIAIAFTFALITDMDREAVAIAFTFALTTDMDREAVAVAFTFALTTDMDREAVAIAVTPSAISSAITFVFGLATVLRYALGIPFTSAGNDAFTFAKTFANEIIVTGANIRAEIRMQRN